IVGSQSGDHLAGGSGNDTISGQGGADHIYGDSGFNLDLNVVRTKVDDVQVHTVARALTVPTTDASTSPTRDTLVAGSDTIHGDGSNLVCGDSGRGSWHTAAPYADVLIETISTTVDDAGAPTGVPGTSVDGADTITAGTGDDTVLGGGFGDDVKVSDGANVVV